jgi:hypothetical protein
LSEGGNYKYEESRAVFDSLFKKCVALFSYRAVTEREAHVRFLRESGCLPQEIEDSLHRSDADADARDERLRTELLRGIRAASAIMNARAEALIDISVLDGDRHADRVPLLLTTNTGRYVLKYGDLTPWSILEDSLRHFTGLQVAPELVLADGPSWGWYLRPWVSAATIRQVPDGQAFGLGMLCGLAVFLNIVDLHFENYVITNDTAMPIDIECMLYHFPNTSRSFDVDTIGMVGPDLGSRAVNGGGTFKQFCEPYVSDDRIHFSRYNQYSEHIIQDHLGQPRGLHEYLQPYSEGFRATISYLKSTLGAIEDIAARSDWLSRKIFRPTRFYRLVMTELQLYGPTMKQEILGQRIRFAGSDSHSFPLLPLHEWERSQLTSGNVPVFHTGVATGAIHSGYKQTKNVLTDSPLSLWRRKVRWLTQERAEGYLNRLTKRILGA